MNRPLLLIFISLQLLILSLNVTQAFSQGIVFSANGPEKIGIQDQAEITYTLQNAGEIKSFTNPQFKEADILGGPFESSSQNIQIIGNRTVQSVNYTLTFVIRPRKLGVIQITPATAKDGAGHTYLSNPLTIQVVANSQAQQRQHPQQRRRTNDPFGDDPFGDDDPFAAMQQHMAAMQQQMMAMQQQMMQQQFPQSSMQRTGPIDLKNDVFIKVTVDKSKVRLGEQITAYYKLYTRLKMQAQISKLPALNGFWTQNFEIPPNPTPQIETFNGQQYQTLLLKKTALFPQESGNLILDPAEVKGIIYTNEELPFTVKSEPVTITVAPITGEKPKTFTGAVGNFSFNQTIDKTTLTTDDVVNLSYKISGSGNFKLFDLNKPTLPNGLDCYDPKIIDTITSRTTEIAGSKIVTYPITPREPGEYLIPGQEFSYYDLSTNSFKTIKTAPITLSVTKGKNYTNNAVSNPTKGFISNLAPLPINIQTKQSFLITNPIYWLICLLSLIAVGAFGKKITSKNTGIPNLKANKIALKRLAVAHQYLKQENATSFYDETSKAIWLYISHKFNIPLALLSKDTSKAILSTKSLPPQLVAKMDQVMQDCELSLYTPSEGRKVMNNTYQNAIEIIAGLESKIKK